MKKRKINKKLSLNKRTVSHLDPGQLKGVKGGEFTDYCTIVCTGPETQCPIECGPFNQETAVCGTYDQTCGCMTGVVTCGDFTCDPHPNCTVEPICL